MLKLISPAVNWMFGDLPDKDYRNPFRWNGHENLEAAYTAMQFLTEEELARPIICREGGRETKFEHVLKAIQELAPLVGKGGSEGNWAVEQIAKLCGQDEASIFQGKVARLHTGEIDSVRLAVDALNEEKLKCPSGMCVMWSDTIGSFCLLYRTDMKDTAYSTFNLG